MRAWSILFLLALFLPGIARADLTKQELKNKEGAHVAWVVQAPLAEAFAAYKEYSEVHFTPSRFLWAEGGKTIADLTDQGAEITMRLQDNPFSSGVFFLIELHPVPGGTKVDYWYANSHWRNNGEKLKALLPAASAAP